MSQHAPPHSNRKLSEREYTDEHRHERAPPGGPPAWHALAPDDVLRRLDSNVQAGLDAAEVPRRLEK